MLHTVRFVFVAAALSGAIAPLVVAPREASAAVVVPLSREALVQGSDLVVRAAVVGRKSAWSADGTRILTWTTLRVEEYLKGSGATEITLRQYGGEVGGVTSEVAGDARLTPGDRAVLFLRRGDGVVFLSALAQAAYRITAKADGVAMVERDLSGLAFARWSSGMMVAAEAPQETLESLAELTRSVRAIATRGRP
jgi:hypothetical protein